MCEGWRHVQGKKSCTLWSTLGQGKSRAAQKVNLIKISTGGTIFVYLCK